MYIPSWRRKRGKEKEAQMEEQELQKEEMKDGSE
jgi:hypothetical protein